MKLSGLNFIGGRQSGNSKETFRAVNPENNEPLNPLYYEAWQEA